MTAPPASRWSWTPRNVVALIVLTALAAGVIGWRLLDRRGRLAADLAVTGVAMPAAAETIDANTASWASLARLPGIGPGRAKAICAYRDQYAQAHGGRPAFTQPEDLMAVSGIGPTLVDGVRRYLTFGEPMKNEPVNPTHGGDGMPRP